jgi:uncharacterized membrane protein YcaP (DUF421 family)
LDPQELLLIAFRATIVYLIVLFVVRLMGKRTIGNVGAFDLIVALIIGESVDEAIYGDVSMVKFVVLIATVTLLHLLNSYLSYKNRTIDHLTESSPRVLVKSGKIDQDALAIERLSEEELWSQLRLQSVDDLKEVKAATLEPSGQVSVILEDWARPVQKGDLPEPEAKQ